MAAQHVPARPRSRVAGYDVFEVLGVGPLGKVYRARRIATGEPVVFRGFSRPPQVPADEWRRVQDKYAECLSEHHRIEAHPSIQKVMDWGVKGDLFYLASEYFEGTTLARLLRDRGPLPLDEALPIFRQAADAIDHANRNGVVHGDLTPYNVLVLPDGSVRVINFGLAHCRDRSDSPYRAPEQLDGSLGHHRSDVYGLAALLSHVLLGRPPFAADNRDELAHQIRSAEPALPDRPRNLREALSRGLAKAPALRFDSAGQMVAEVARERRQPEAVDEATPVPWAPVGEQPTLGLHEYGLVDQDFVEAQRRLTRERRVMLLQHWAGRAALAVLPLWFVMQALAVPGACRYAEVAATKGLVEARVLDPAKGYLPAQTLTVGAEIDGWQQTLIHTGEDSEVVLRLAGSRVKVGASTLLLIRGLGYEHGRLRLFTLPRGRLWAQVDPLRRRGSRFQVRSGGATVSVHGTTFGVDHGPSQLTVTTVEGQVQVKTDQGQQTVAGGQQLTGSDQGKLDAPAALTAAEAQQAADEAVGKLRRSFLDRLSSWADGLGDATVVSIVDAAIGVAGENPAGALARSLRKATAGSSAHIAMRAIATSLRMEDEVPAQLTLDTLAELGLKPRDANRILACFKDRKLESYRKLGPEQYEFTARAADADGTPLRCRNGRVMEGEGSGEGGS